MATIFTLRLQALALCLSVTVFSGQTWTDRAEYDLVLALRNEAVPAKRLEIIEAWKEKYPNSQLRTIRAELQLSALEMLADVPKMLAVSREIVEADPSNLLGIYWLTALGPSSKKPTPETLAAIEQAAKKLPLAAENAAPSVEEWPKRRAQVEILSCRALGWVDWQRGSLDSAEKELRACLRKDPQLAEVSSWLGTVLALQKKPDKQLEAIWLLARAVALDSEGALPPTQRRDARLLLERAYASYHGEVEGVDEIIAQTKDRPEPPANFRIETAHELEQRLQDNELIRSNPAIEPWLKLRRQLEGSEGEQVLESMKGTSMPRLRGFVVRQVPAARPREIYVGLLDAATEEIVIKVDGPLQAKSEPGTPIEFEAIPVSFTTQPFLLTVTCTRAKMEMRP